MSKKRLHKKNIKTKKIRGGNGSNLSSQVQNLGATAQSVGSNLGATAQSVGSNLGTTAQTVANSVANSVANTAQNFTQNVAQNVANQAFPEKEIGLASKFVSGVKNISLKVPLSPEDKFSQALLKLRTNPKFSTYFTTTINQVMVSEFYKVLKQLGEYSEHYSKSVKQIIENTGEFIYDGDDNFYSDLSSESTVPNNKEEPPKCDDDNNALELDNTNLDKITENENINYFLEKAMMIHVPAIEEIFKKLKNVINKYKILRNRMNKLLEKAERENDAETYFEDFRELSLDATGLIDAIFYEFDTKKVVGGAICPSENKEPTLPLNVNDYESQLLVFDPANNSDCKIDSTKKFEKLNELYEKMNDTDKSNKKNITNVVDVFNDSMLYMCIRGRKKFSQILKRKLAGILNKIINRLYEIANAKNIIDDEEEIAPTFLETKGETTLFDIGEYENKISDKVNQLKDTVEKLEIQKIELDKKKNENIENINQNLKNMIPRFKGGADILLPEKYREQANTMLDNFSLNNLLIESENDNLEIVKFQKIVVKIVKKLFCKILEKTDINLEPFKEIVTPAFKEKQKEFGNLEKIWTKDLKEKKDLIKKIDPSKVDKDILDYVEDVEKEIDWAIKNQESIKKYIKSDKEKKNIIPGGTTQKSSSLVSRKTRRHKRTSQ